MNWKWRGLSKSRLTQIKKKRLKNLRLAIKGKSRSRDTRNKISIGRRLSRIKNGAKPCRCCSYILNGNGPFYVSIKGKKKAHAVLVYEKNCGPVPKRFIVHHVDGNNKNDKPRNLLALSRSHHTSFHKFWRAVNYWEGKKISGRKVLKKFLNWERVKE